jgi:hypothetical protein
VPGVEESGFVAFIECCGDAGGQQVLRIAQDDNSNFVALPLCGEHFAGEALGGEVHLFLGRTVDGDGAVFVEREDL